MRFAVPRAVVAALAAIVLALAPGIASGTNTTLRYAFQVGFDKWIGIDGYLRQSGIPDMADPNTHHHNMVLQLCPQSPTQGCESWLQVGQYQGTGGEPPCPGATCIRSVDFVHGFWENLLECSDWTYYDVDDTGDEHQDPNVQYFISWVSTGLSPCDLNQQKFAFRKGWVSAPPDGYGYLSTKTNYPAAWKEVSGTQELSLIGIDRFGLSDTGQVIDGYGLHLKDPSTGQWPLWAGNIAVVTDQPPYFCLRKANSAFHTRGSPAAGCQ